MNKSILYILSLSLLVCISESSVYAQAPVQSIFDLLTQGGPGRGKVTITQSSFIRSVVGRRPESFIAVDNQDGFSKMKGFRIQIYSGNRPNSKSIAEERARRVSELKPEYNTYVKYKAPFWRLHVGNFLTYQEAQAAMHQLKNAVPMYSKEMIVVRDQVFIQQP
ncbi:SPOR domain-containing protein [Porphyromonas sp.]|uniref:SPOR domain-containing protein n=1 Tax=Porphyromonas sp. TaxID=1924944 RepID=UPI0026DC9288|nr:SPOR domain-containing protein [Porphyromonas sp.]MDO4695686.1 SPOR domain-containing protein [Porphyromonas sp.]MDO4771707.1 SPOR domain-containing protein [Porphyromonas sp.]